MSEPSQNLPSNADDALRVEADAIEMRAANISYGCGLGVSEWESFLGESGHRLAELARLGYGTWAKEGNVPAPWRGS